MAAEIETTQTCICPKCGEVFEETFIVDLNKEQDEP
jgi:hypothetical protein